MEPMLEPFEERSFAAVPATAGRCVHRRSHRRRRRGWPEVQATRRLPAPAPIRRRPSHVTTPRVHVGPAVRPERE